MRWSQRVVAGVIITGLYAWWVRTLWWLCDDAFISFAYGRHLVEGHGLRFNLGAGNPVEGYSNLLWVLLAASIEASGGDVPTLVPVASVACGCATLVAVYVAAVRGLGTPASAALCALTVLACCPPFAAWSTGGLETMALTLMLFLAVSFSVEAIKLRRWGWGVLSGMALALLRPEGLLWAVMVWGGAAWLRGRGAPWSAEGAKAVLKGAIIAALGQLLFRWGYYGTWLPNTVAAKVSSRPTLWWRGLSYVLLFAMTWGVPILALGWRWLRGHPRWLVLQGYGLVSLGVVMFSVLVGGDYLPFHRFLVPALPLMTIPLAIVFEEVARRSPARAVVCSAAMVLCMALPATLGFVLHEPAMFVLQQHVGTKYSEYRTDHFLLSAEARQVPRRRARARAIMEIAKPGASFVARGVGALGYDADLRILDVHGLVSREVVTDGFRRRRLIAPGHDRRVSRAFFLEEQPQFLFAFALDRPTRGLVMRLLPTQWGLFEDLGDDLVYVADLHEVRASGPDVPEHLLVVRLLRPGEDADEVKVRFKEAVRAAGYRAPRLAPLDERRRAVAIEKRAGGEHLMEVLWGPGGIPR